MRRLLIEKVVNLDPSPSDRILDQNKFKALADDKMNVIK